MKRKPTYFKTQKNNIFGLTNSSKLGKLTLSNKTIDKDDFIIINYYQGLDRCNASGNKYAAGENFRWYLEKLEKRKNVKQFFMYHSPEDIEDYGKHINWIADEFDTIRKLFLPINYPCGSFVLIDKNGNFYVQKGEYNTEYILKLIRNKKTFSGKH